MALSTSEKRYADGSPALREQWHYRGRFDLLAKESRAANDDRSYFYPVVTGPDGAPQEMYSANGRKVWTKHRSLWGLAANDSPDSERESCDAGFMGQWQDEESGLWYNLHRYYDAGTGQYLSQDPLKLSGGLNTQSYVHDPVGWCDPWGLMNCAVVEADGTLKIKNKYEPGSPEDLTLQKHVADWNAQIEANGGSMTRQAVTPKMRGDATKAANNARTANPSAYPQGISPGHTPDVGWGGAIEGPIIPLHSRVNSYVGGATQAIPAGTTYTKVVLF
ncbi:RHS repeat-associated core domain-containing protein [Escherichia coli]